MYSDILSVFFHFCVLFTNTVLFMNEALYGFSETVQLPVLTKWKASYRAVDHTD